MAVLRTAYVEIKPDLDRFRSELKTQIAKIDADREGRKFGGQLGDGFSKGFKDKGNAFTAALAAMTARMTVAGAAGASAAPGIAQLTAALVPAAGAAAALPAAMLAIKAASATVKVATAGVSEAISKGFTGSAKEAAKALEELPPAARTFAKSIIALKPEVEDLKASVAQRFFLPMQDDIAKTAQIYLPLMKKNMSDLAGPLGGLGEQLLQTARSGQVIRGISDLFENTGHAAVRLRTGVDAGAKAFGSFISATAPFLPKIAQGLSDMAVKAGDFVTKASETGKVAEVIRNGWATIKDLGGIIANVGSILTSVFRASNLSGQGLLKNLRDLTGQVAAFLKSAEGSSTLQTVFQSLGQLGQAMRTSLGAVLPAIAEAVRALLPAIGNLAPALAQIVVAVAPLIPLLTQVIAKMINGMVPAIQALAKWLQENQGVLKAFAVAVGVAFAAVKIYVVFTKAAAIATTVWTVAQKAAAVASKVWAAAQVVLNAALRANPIGLVITAVVGLGAALVLAYKKSETFRNVVNGVWKTIQAAVKYAWENVIRPAVQAMVTFFNNVIAPAVRWLYNNVFRPLFQAIGLAVKAAWVVIQIALKAFELYLKNVVFPVIRFLYNNVVKPIFQAVGKAISTWYNNVAKPVFSAAKTAFQALGTALKAVWDNVVRPMFNAFGNFLKNTVAPAFRTGVDAIRKAWESVKEAARKPVSFVVNSVINPLINGINSAAKFVGVKDRIPTIPGFQQGGQIPGAPSLKDNRLARGPKGLLAVASGEFITNTKSTLANLPLLKTINAKKGRVTRDDIDPVLDGYANGGPIGDGFGDLFDKIVNGAKGLTDFVTDPKGALKRLADSFLSKIPAAGSLTDLLRGMGNRLVNGAGSWLMGKISGGGAIGNAGVAGGWKGMQRLISARFPGLRLISGFRPGSITVTGNRSYHGLGRAVDYPPNRALAAWIKGTYGAKTKELITPWQDLNLHNGRPHRYTGAVWRTHNFAGGNAHVHWAAQNGGLVGRKSGLMPFGSYDSGGYLPTGLSIAHNGTGRPEPVGHGLGGNTYNITVQVPPGAHPAEVGRQTVEAIKAYEARNGARWRK